MVRDESEEGVRGESEEVTSESVECDGSWEWGGSEKGSASVEEGESVAEVRDGKMEVCLNTLQ